MRICSPQLGFAPNSILGGEVFDRQILLGLAKRGVKVEIILPLGKPYEKGIKNWNLTFIPLSHFPAFVFNFLIIPYLFLIYRRRKFDIIRIHQPQFVGLGCLLFKFFHPEVKLVATYHQFRESNFLNFSAVINNRWDGIVCDSQNAKNKIIKKYHLSSSKILVVHNGVPPYLKPTAKDKELVNKLNLKNKIVLLFMGLFIERKNPLFLIDVFLTLLKRRSDLILIFWGMGPLQSNIESYAQNLRLSDKIIIQKPLFGQVKNKIHNLADIFVHPALDEGFALSPLEAMACAKPIVITKGYSASEAVDDGVNGFLCQANNIHQWTQSLIKLIDNRALTLKMGRASLAKVKREFQWKSSVTKHIKFFNEIIK